MLLGTALFLIAAVFLITQFSSTVEADEADDWPMFRLNYHHEGYKDGLAPDTNQTMWTFDTGTNNRWIVSSPMIVDDYVYIGSENGKLYKLNLADGTEVWNYTADENGGWAHFWSSPYVDLENNMVLCHADGVHAINLTTGERIWHFQSAVREFSSPVVHDGVVFVGSYDNCIYAIPQTDPNGDGTITEAELVWIYYSGEYQNGARVDDTGGAVSTTLAVVDGMVFGAEQTQLDSGSSYCDYNAFALPEIDPDGSGEIEHGEIIWKYEIGEHLPVIDTGVPGEGGDCFSSPAVNVDENHVYIGSRDQFVYCLSIEPDGDNLDNDGDGIFDNEGEMIWRTPVDNEIYSSPSFHNGNVFIGSGMYSTAGSPGSIYCFRQSDGGEVWSFQNTDGFLSSPLVADGKVFIGCNDETIYVRNESDGEPLWEFVATAGNENAFGSSPSLYKDQVVIGSCNGLVYCFNTPRINYEPEIDLLGPFDLTILMSSEDPMLTWSASDPNPGDTLLYDIYVHEDSEAVLQEESQALVASDLTLESYSVDGLEQGERYYWKVVVKDDEFNVSSDLWRFSVNSKPIIELIDPIEDEIITTTEVRLSWESEDGDNDDLLFTVYLDTNEDPTTIIEEDIEDDDLDVTDLVDGETYYWKILVSDGIENTTSEMWSLSIDLEAASNIAPTVTLDLPEDGTILSETEVTLSWSGNDEDDDDLVYSVYCDASTDPTTLIAEDLENTEVDVVNLSEDVAYYWKVIVSDGIDETKSVVWTFSVDFEYIGNVPPEIELKTPQEGQILFQTSLPLLWKGDDPDYDKLTYDVYLGIDPNSTTLVSEDQKQEMYSCIGLQWNQTYYWYVVVKDGTHEVSSETGSFTIAPEEVEVDDDDDSKEWYEEIADEPIYLGGIALFAAIIVIAVILMVQSRPQDYQYDDYDDEDDWGDWD